MAPAFETTVRTFMHLVETKLVSLDQVYSSDLCSLRTLGLAASLPPLIQT